MHSDLAVFLIQSQIHVLCVSRGCCLFNVLTQIRSVALILHCHFTSTNIQWNMHGTCISFLSTKITHTMDSSVYWGFHFNAAPYVSVMENFWASAYNLFNCRSSIQGHLGLYDFLGLTCHSYENSILSSPQPCSLFFVVSKILHCLAK